MRSDDMTVAIATPAIVSTQGRRTRYDGRKTHSLCLFVQNNKGSNEGRKKAKAPKINLLIKI